MLVIYFVLLFFLTHNISRKKSKKIKNSTIFSRRKKFSSLQEVMTFSQFQTLPSLQKYEGQIHQQVPSFSFFFSFLSFINMKKIKLCFCFILYLNVHHLNMINTMSGIKVWKKDKKKKEKTERERDGKEDFRQRKRNNKLCRHKVRDVVIPGTSNRAIASSYDHPLLSFSCLLPLIFSLSPSFPFLFLPLLSSFCCR